MIGQSKENLNVEFSLINKKVIEGKDLLTDYKGKPVGGYKFESGRNVITLFKGDSFELPLFVKICVNVEAKRIAILRRIEATEANLTFLYFLEVYDLRGNRIYDNFHPTIHGANPVMKISSKGNIYITGRQVDENDNKNKLLFKHNLNGNLIWKKIISHSIVYDLEVSNDDSIIVLYQDIIKEGKANYIVNVYNEEGNIIAKRDLDIWYEDLKLTDSKQVILTSISSIVTLDLRGSLELKEEKETYIDNRKTRLVTYVEGKSSYIYIDFFERDSIYLNVCSFENDKILCSSRFSLTDINITSFENSYFNQNEDILYIFSKGILYSVAIKF